MSEVIEKKRLYPKDFSALLSHYLTEGRKQDIWRIDLVEIQGDTLNAEISMQSFFASGTDAKGFHLTIFSTLEFLSQLMIIFAHHWAGVEKKVREGWMVESSVRAVRAIRDPENIRVEMQVRKICKRGIHLYCVADFRVTDEEDGLFEVSLKGFLS